MVLESEFLQLLGLVSLYCDVTLKHIISEPVNRRNPE